MGKIDLNKIKKALPDRAVVTLNETSPGHFYLDIKNWVEM